MTQYKEPHALGQREVMGLTEVELMLQGEFKGAALLQHPKFILFQTKLMPHIHLCAHLYANTELQLFVCEPTYMLPSHAGNLLFRIGF